MRMCKGAWQSGRFFLVLVVAVAFVPLEVEPAEARGIKIRTRTGGSHAKSAAENADQSGRSVNIRIRSSGRSSKESDDTDSSGRKLKVRPRSPGAAETAAERARAALEAEKAMIARPAATLEPKPAPGGKTTTYPGGAMCVAGC